MKTVSQRLYDQIADDYIGVSEKRAAYIRNINNLIIEYAPKVNKRFLDVGAGDGIRSMEIARGVGAQYISLIDNSEEMAKLCKKMNVDEVHHTSIADYTSELQYDLITSLWNVFGHMDSRKERIESLKKLGTLLTDNGLIMLDINNRYNVNYGYINVFKNVIADNNPFIKNKPGWFTFSLNNNNFPVYLHSPFEFIRIIKEAGLKIVMKCGVNYLNGMVTKNYIFGGQMFFILEKS